MAEAPGKDRRRSGRWIARKHAIIIPEQGESVRCVALDWGSGGALLEVDGQERITGSFNLLVGDDDLLVSCTVARRLNRGLGVQFSNFPMRATRFGVVSGVPAKRSVTGPMISLGAFSSKFRGRTK